MRFTHQWAWVVLGSIATSVTACREKDAPRPHYRDLGAEGAPLLPSAPPKYAISDPRTGTADWHPFRAPTEDAEEPGEDEPGAKAPVDEVEDEIRELIADYNEIAAAKDVEELLNYYLEEQQEELKPVLEIGSALGEKLPGLAAALDEKLPDQIDRVDAALAQLGWERDGRLVTALSAESLTVINDTEVTAKLSGGLLGSTCRFLLIEDEWFIEVPDAVDIAGLRPALDAALTACDESLAALAAGEVPAEEILARLDAAGKTLGR